MTQARPGLIAVPQLPEPFPDTPPIWTCPITGLDVPKDIDANLRWREKILDAAEKDDGFQRDMYSACSESILFWINAFVWTHRVFITDPDGITRTCAPHETHVPFVTWAVQDEHILTVEDAINQGYDLLSDKSRDMGATWDQVSTLHHQWTFRADRTFLEISRKENCVDVLGGGNEAGSDPGTLFGKHDYILRWQPDWLKPMYGRKKMHLLNLQNRSRIDGESANASAGSSDRRTAILLDEMAKMAEGESIKRSTRDVTACRLPNSTPNGPGTAFSAWRQSSQIKVFVLPWWEHPEKGLGRYTKQEETTGKWEIRSPYYDHEDEIRSPREMAIELDMDHIASGETYFESHVVETHRRLFAKDAKKRYKIDFLPTVANAQIPTILQKRHRGSIQARISKIGPWRIWCPLINGRPDQHRDYIFGIDVSKGQGASNSVIVVMEAKTHEVVAEFADATVPPYELARVTCAAALWFGGAAHGQRPFIIWEANGPGWDFGRQMVKVYRYPYYYVARSVGEITEKRGKKYGWNSSREKKEIALGILRRALAHGGVVIHSAEMLDEALMYVYYDGGGIGPASMQMESAEARKCHGDRVIGVMLCCTAAEEVRGGKPKPKTPPPGSMGYRRQQIMNRRRREKHSRDRNKHFDFRGVV